MGAGAFEKSAADDGRSGAWPRPAPLHRLSTRGRARPPAQGRARGGGVGPRNGRVPRGGAQQRRATAGFHGCGARAAGLRFKGALCACCAHNVHASAPCARRSLSSKGLRCGQAARRRGCCGSVRGQARRPTRTGRSAPPSPAAPLAAPHPRRPSHHHQSPRPPGFTCGGEHYLHFEEALFLSDRGNLLMFDDATGRPGAAGKRMVSLQEAVHTMVRPRALVRRACSGLDALQPVNRSICFGLRPKAAASWKLRFASPRRSGARVVAGTLKSPAPRRPAARRGPRCALASLSSATSFTAASCASDTSCAGEACCIRYHWIVRICLRAVHRRLHSELAQPGALALHPCAQLPACSRAPNRATSGRVVGAAGASRRCDLHPPRPLLCSVSAPAGTLRGGIWRRGSTPRMCGAPPPRGPASTAWSPLARAAAPRHPAREKPAQAAAATARGSGGGERTRRRERTRRARSSRASGAGGRPRPAGCRLARSPHRRRRRPQPTRRPTISSG